MTASEAFQNLRSVHDELAAAEFALGRAIEHVSSDPTLLRHRGYPLKRSSILRCRENLELTYVVRLFAEFEALLRGYWASIQRGRLPRRSSMEALMNRIASRRYMPADVLRDAHEVREYRNAIMHDRRGVGILSFARCKSRLSQFISYLPRSW